MITAFLLRQKVSAGFSLITLFSICLINSVVMSFSIILKAVSKFSASLSKKAYFSVWIFTSNSFTLKESYYSENGYSGWYSGWVEDGGTEGELTLYVDSVFGDAKAIDRIELEFIRRGSYEELLIDEVRPSVFQLEFGTSFWRYR